MSDSFISPTLRKETQFSEPTRMRFPKVLKSLLNPQISSGLDSHVVFLCITVKTKEGRRNHSVPYKELTVTSLAERLPLSISLLCTARSLLFTLRTSSQCVGRADPVPHNYRSRKNAANKKY